MNKKAQTYLGVSILSVIMVYGFYIMNLKTRLINEKGRYTIGVIQRTKIGSKGIRVFINYSYGNKVELVDYIEDYVERNKLRIGRRIFIKFIPENDVKYIKLNLECTVPDSIKNAPLYGWSEQWMKEKFPDYMQLINKY